MDIVKINYDNLDFIIPKEWKHMGKIFFKSYFEPFDKKLTLKSSKLDDFYTLNFPNLLCLKN